MRFPYSGPEYFSHTPETVSALPRLATTGSLGTSLGKPFPSGVKDLLERRVQSQQTSAGHQSLKGRENLATATPTSG